MKELCYVPRSRYEDLKENPSNYFFNLESRNYYNEVMDKLVNEKGENLLKLQIFWDAKKIFYQNLYFNHTNIDDQEWNTV